MKEKPPLVISDQHRMAIKADGTKMPVIDSKLTTVIQPNEEDIKKGIPGDFANCMYCLACRRMFGSELVWVTRMLAYVEMKGKGGKPELHRFILTEPAKAAIGDFDAGRDVTPEAVVFAAPKGSQRLDHVRKRTNPLVKGKIRGPISGHHRPKPLAQALRDPATGRFQFSH